MKNSIIKSNFEIFNQMNIPIWLYEYGYTGKGVNIATTDTADPSLDFFYSNIENPFNVDYCLKSHGQKVLDILFQVAPNTKVHMIPRLEHNIEVDNYLIKNNISMFTCSIGGNNRDDIQERIENIKKASGIAFFTSAGNIGEDGLKNYAASEQFISIGAVHYIPSRKYDPIFTPHYSSRGEELDYVAFSKLDVHNINYVNSNEIMVEGTSFSAPLFVGALCLVQEFFIEKIGRQLKEKELILFINDHLKDLDEEGFDIKTGNGLLILPSNPNDIDIDKYILEDINNGGDDDMSDTFTDIKGHWCEEKIKKFKAKGYVNGFPDGSFKPDEKLSRAEVIDILYDVLSENKLI